MVAEMVEPVVRRRTDLRPLAADSITIIIPETTDKVHRLSINTIIIRTIRTIRIIRTIRRIDIWTHISCTTGDRNSRSHLVIVVANVCVVACLCVCAQHSTHSNVRVHTTRSEELLLYSRIDINEHKYNHTQMFQASRVAL